MYEPIAMKVIAKHAIIVGACAAAVIVVRDVYVLFIRN